jgi:DNA polymerase III subunit gamma/tau
MDNLALKYRPKTFDDLVEQKNVKYILQSMCEQENLPNRNFLLIGSRGIGKTTSARIMAGQLNGNQNQTIEIDAASHNGVDAIREIVQQAQLYPIGAKYKVFIIDEVHALSSAGWQSMLKVLEEQPAKTVFILCTTNPEKIPATIISRVQVFQLSNISLDGIVSRLKYVIEEENKQGAHITYEDDAISYIAKLAKGGMRDSLTLLQKALVYSENITSESLKYSLNIPEYDDYFTLLNAYAKKESATIMMIVSNVYNSGVNFVKWFEGFQSFVINIAKYVFLQDINQTMIPSYYQDKVSKYTTKHAQVCLQLSQVLVELIARISRTEYMEEVAISYLLGRR